MKESKEIKRTEISELGEFGLIEHLTKDVTPKNQSTVKGVGDDSAVINCEKSLLLVSTDSLVEGLHFNLMYTPLQHLGYKAVVVSLSDIYAMNGEPKQITVSISISNKYSVEAIEELYAGIKLACQKYNVDLVGGDTTSSLKGLFINVTALGFADPDKIVYRNGAKPGDLLCVSGNLGASYIGLQLLEREKQVFLENPEIQPDLVGQEYTVGRQLKPEPKADLIKQFHKLNLLPTSMIDVSDGLSSEILHICRSSDVGCLLYEDRIPVHPDTYNTALKFNIDPTTCALNGGEDYELLFTVNPSDEPKLGTLDDIAIIGEIKESSEAAKLQTRQGNLHNLMAQGWKSFE